MNKFLLTVLAFSLILFNSFSIFSAPKNKETYEYLDLFGQVFDRVRSSYVDDVRQSIVNSDCLMGDIAKSEKIGITVDSGHISELTSALIEIERKNKIIKLDRDWTGEAKRLVSAYSSIGNGS